MKTSWMMLAAASLIGLAGCNSSSSSNNNTGPEGGRPTPVPEVTALDELVRQECRLSPENEEPTPINGRGFSATPGNFSSCL